jgi:hypothetical protein
MTILDSRSYDPAASSTPAAPSAAARVVIGADQASPAAAISRDPVERLEALFDRGTIRLLTPPDASGAVTACGQIAGMSAAGFATDPGVQGGAMGSAGCAAIVAAYEEALAWSTPVIGLWHSGGARLREGVEIQHAVGTVFAAMTRASGGDSADLGSARPGRRRRRLRACPHRSGRHVGAGTDLRDRPRGGAQRDRRETWTWPRSAVPSRMPARRG